MAVRFGATPFDIDDVFWSHEDELCTFDVRIEQFGLRSELLVRLAAIVRAAHVSRLGGASETAGLADPARPSDTWAYLEGKAPLPPGPARPPANIVLLSDGTGNGASSLFKTNVRRLYEALDVADPKDPKHPRQFAFYDNGVGTSSFRPLTLLGGAFGVGLARNIREIYAFLCRTYRPGDRIYAFGFSRGAFTIRTLAGC